MRNILVVVRHAVHEEEQAALMLGAMRHRAYPLYANEPEGHSEYRDSTMDISSWKCEEVDVPIVVDHLTKNFPGKEVEVYRLESIHFRPLGEVQNKSVTKNGILPA